MTSTFRITLGIMSVTALLLLPVGLQAEQGSGSGMGKGSAGESMKGKGGEQHSEQKHEDMGQAGSKGQQGMKGGGSPMEQDTQGGDKMIGEKKDMGKKKK